jgi:hypothetical protein
MQLVHQNALEAGFQQEELCFVKAVFIMVTHL